MKLRASILPRKQSAYTIIECLVYIGLVFALLGVGYAGMYRCISNSVALRRNADDIMRSLHAGERWRADLRAATAPPRLDSSSTEQVLVVPTSQGDLLYRFAPEGVFRRAPGHPWSQVLSGVQSASVESEKRQNITIWRWELELQTKANAGRVRPLFTFIAVPGGNQ